MSGTVFKIENGRLAFSLVDKAAVGYADDWQAPGGKDLSNVTLVDYTGSLPAGSGGDYSCQITSGGLIATPNTTDETLPGTFCEPEKTITNVGVTSYTLDVTGRQDPNIVAGISRYLFENDTKEAYFYLGMGGAAGDDPPTAIGRVRIIAGQLGGDARITLAFTLSLPVTGKPDVEFGDATTSEIVAGGTGTLLAAETPAAESSSTSSRKREPVEVGA